MPTAVAQTATMAQMITAARNAGFAGNDAIIAGAVGMAESSGNTHALNYVPCAGVWQINLRAHPQYNMDDMFDLQKNANAAYAIFRAQGWQAWSTYTSGAYKRYMAAATKAAGASGATAGIGDIGGPLNPWQIGTGIGTSYKDITAVLNALQDPATWRRSLLIIVGVIMILIGLIKMSATPKNIKLATDVAKVIK